MMYYTVPKGLHFINPSQAKRSVGIKEEAIKIEK